MIVKNESSIIVSTLDHLQRHFDIDFWAICDTGSTDKTVALVQDYLVKHQLKGQVLKHVWQDFSHNRNLALQACRGQADYILFWDADDRIEGNFQLPHLEHDAYALKLKEQSGVIHYRYLLVKDDLPCIWRSKLHEFIAFSPYSKMAVVSGDYQIKVGHFGARSQNKNKYAEDAEKLGIFYLQEDDIFLKARYAYYCGLSYLNTGQYKKAKLWFEKRLAYTQQYPNIVFNSDESYESLLKLAYIAIHLKRFLDAETYLKVATQDFLERFEAFYELSRLYLQHKHFQLAYDCAKIAQNVAKNLSEHMTYYQDFPIVYGIDLQLLTTSLSLGELELAYQHVLPLLEKEPFSNQFYGMLLTAISELKVQCISERNTQKKQLIFNFLNLPQYKNSQIIKMRKKILKQLEVITASLIA